MKLLNILRSECDWSEQLRVDLRWSEEIQAKFQKLVACIGLITKVSLKKDNERRAQVSEAEIAAIEVFRSGVGQKDYLL